MRSPVVRMKWSICIPYVVIVVSMRTFKLDFQKKKDKKNTKRKKRKTKKRNTKKKQNKNKNKKKQK